MFSKIQFMSDLSSKELRNQLHSSQYRQLILLLLLHRPKNSLEHQHTRATVESFLEENLLSDLSGVKNGGSRDLLGTKKCLLSC